MKMLIETCILMLVRISFVLETFQIVVVGDGGA